MANTWRSERTNDDRSLGLRGADRADLQGAGGGGVRCLDQPRAFSDDPSNTQQLIELAFSESEGATTVVMVNSGITTDERRDAQDYGWRGCFDELERALASS